MVKGILSRIFIVLLSILWNSAIAQSEIQFLKPSFSAAAKMQSLIIKSVNDQVVFYSPKFYNPGIRIACGNSGEPVLLLQYKDVKVRLDADEEGGAKEINPQWISEISIDNSQNVKVRYPNIKNPYEVVIVLKKRTYRKLSDHLKEKLYFYN